MALRDDDERFQALGERVMGLVVAAFLVVAVVGIVVSLFVDSPTPAVKSTDPTNPPTTRSEVRILELLDLADIHQDQLSREDDRFNFCMDFAETDDEWNRCMDG